MRNAILSVVSLLFALSGSGGCAKRGELSPATRPDAPAGPAASTASTRTDCTMKAPTTPLFAAVQPNGQAPIATPEVDGLTETVQLTSGLTLRVTHGGCNDLSEAWSVTPAPEGQELATLQDALGQVSFAAPENKPEIVACVAQLAELGPEGGVCERLSLTTSSDGPIYTLLSTRSL